MIITNRTKTLVINLVVITKKIHLSLYFSYLSNASVKDSCKSPPWVFQLPNSLKPNTNYTFQVFKGTHIKTVLSSRDANFIANSSISKAYYSWIKNMKVSAEEHHTATLLRLNVDERNVSLIFFCFTYSPY